MRKKNVLLTALLSAALLVSAGGIRSVVDADAATTRYEAESATIVGEGTAVKSGYGDNTASGSWVGDMNNNTSIDFPVTVAEDGEYQLILHYASGSSAASLKVHNADGLYKTVSCPATSGWGCFVSLETSVSLRAGESTVSIKKGDEYVELDYIEIGDKTGDYKSGETVVLAPNHPANPTEGYTRYEAEDGTLNNCNFVNTYGTFSGTGFAGDLNDADAHVEFNVTVDADGEYAMNVGYATDPAMGDPTLKIYNADGFYAEIACAVKTTWGSFTKEARAATTVSLRAGENSVKVYKGTSYAQVDFIEIGAKVGDYKEGGEEIVDPNDIKQPTEGYTRYESEEGTHNATLYTEGEFSGTGYVGDLNNANQYVEYTVTVTEAGEYSIGIAYATGMQGATLKVHNSEGFYNEVSCSTVKNWGIFSKEAIVLSTISLKAGENTVRVYKGAEYAQVDFIEIGAKTGDYVEKAWTTVSKQIAALSADEITATNYETVKAAVVAAETAYANLSQAEQANVTNYETLTARKAAVVAYEEAEAQKQANASAVVAQINALSADEITAQNYESIKTAVEQAEGAYNLLTDGEKALVTNYETLTARKAAVVAYEEAEAQKQANANAVMEMITNLSTDEITAQNYEAVKAEVIAVESAYGNLTLEEKALVTNYETLTARRVAITAYEESLLPGGDDSSDTTSSDTASSDVNSSDTGSSDTTSSDTGSSDTTSSDTGSSDTVSSDTGSSDTTSSDTESESGSESVNGAGCWASVSGVGMLAGLAVVAGARLITKKKEN